VAFPLARLAVFHTCLHHNITSNFDKTRNQATRRNPLLHCGLLSTRPATASPRTVPSHRSLNRAAPNGNLRDTGGSASHRLHRWTARSADPASRQGDDRQARRTKKVQCTQNQRLCWVACLHGQGWRPPDASASIPRRGTRSKVNHPTSARRIPGRRTFDRPPEQLHDQTHPDPPAAPPKDQYLRSYADSSVCGRKAGTRRVLGVTGEGGHFGVVDQANAPRRPLIRRRFCPAEREIGGHHDRARS
jgi:hypothetical protein